jgi:tetratricopeptide (TPR) repeat protein
LANLADVRLAEGRYDEAMELYRKAMAIDVETRGEKHLHVAYTLTGMGKTELARGRLEEARDHLARALVIWEKDASAEPVERGRCRFQLAKASWSEDPKGARTMAKAARLEMRAQGPGYQDEVAEVGRWLGEHE